MNKTNETRTFTLHAEGLEGLEIVNNQPFVIPAAQVYENVIPITVAAATLETVKMLNDPMPRDWAALWVGFIVSAIAGYLCIKYFLHFLNRYGMWPHVLYRIVLSVILFIVFI